MGSRAVVVVCQDANIARERFGVTEGEIGIVYTRTGRRFFDDADLEAAFLDRIVGAMSDTESWRTFNTAWTCLDCELMPWSIKAQALLRSQYAAVGAAGRASVPNAVAMLERTADRIGGDGAGRSSEVLTPLKTTNANLDRFTEAYRQYCWSVDSLDDLKLAPFHLLATENAVHVGEDHRWHMSHVGDICESDKGILLATEHRVVDVTNPEAVADGCGGGLTSQNAVVKAWSSSHWTLSPKGRRA